MRVLILLISILFNISVVSCQFIWDKEFKLYNNGERWAGEPTGVVETSDKGFIVCGSGAYKNGAQMGFLYKLNQNGDSVWFRIYETTGANRIATIFYDKNKKLMIAMEYQVPNKKQNIVFASLNESTGDTSNSFFVPKPSDNEAYKYVGHIEMHDGSYIVAAADAKDFVPEYSHLVRFMPGSNAPIWHINTSVQKWVFQDIILDGQGIVCVGSERTSPFMEGYLVVRYSINGNFEWSKTLMPPSIMSYSGGIVKGSSNYITVGNKILPTGSDWQTYPAVALVTNTGDTLSYKTLNPPEWGYLTKILKHGNTYYATGQVQRHGIAPDSSVVWVYNMAIFSVSENGDFKISKEFNFGFVRGKKYYFGAESQGRGLLSTSDNKLFVYGVKRAVRQDSTMYMTPYILKLNTPVMNGLNSRENILFNLYPNPATGCLTIINNGKVGNLKITNLLGQEVVSQYIEGNTEATVINVDCLPAGTYVVVFECGDGILTERLVIAQ